MKKPFAPGATDSPDLVPSDRSNGIIGAWARFWFLPINPLALHAVRIAAGLAFLVWLLPIAGHAAAFYGPDGWVDLQAYQELGELSDGPTIGWSIFYLAGTSSAMTVVLYWFCILAIVLFTLGVWPRLTGVLTWLAVLSFTANPLLTIDAHSLYVLLATYLMLGYLLLGQESSQLSAAARVLGPVHPLRGDAELSRPSIGPRIALRILQLHLALAIMISGIHKLQFPVWLSGDAFWYALNPALEATEASLRKHADHPTAYLTWIGLAAYAALAWQILFPVFAWRRLGWALVPIGGLVSCVAMPILYGDPMYGTALLAGSAAFVPVSVWERVAARMKRLVGREEVKAPEQVVAIQARKTERTAYLQGAR